MLQIKNTINCPACKAVLRVSARVISDGNEYHYYFCCACQDVVKKGPATGQWALRGSPSPKIPELVRELQSMAVDEWMDHAADRSQRTTRCLSLVGAAPKA